MQRERETKRHREGERVCVCFYVCVHMRERPCVYERERPCAYERERDRVRMRKREFVCV